MSKQSIFNLVSDFFDGDNEKTYLWFTTIHPHLGQTPMEMIRKGRSGKLLKYVIAQLEENKI